MKNNIILIGMPGSGKSSAGVLAAKALGLDFIDTDLLIQKKYSMKLADIIRKYGNNAFINCETDIMLSLKNVTGAVIATGGSAVLSDKAMQTLKENGFFIYLEVPSDILGRRISNMSSRGIVMKKNETISDIYTARRSLYEKYADAILPVNSADDAEKTVAGIVSMARSAGII